MRNDYKSFIKIAYPSVMESFLVSMVSIFDTMMVAGLGEQAIAAVGITNQPKFILLAVIFSLNVGVVAVASRRKGQNDREGANRALFNSMIISVSLATVLAIFGIIFARPIIQLAGAKGDYIDQAVIYYRIIAVSVIFQALNLTINAAQRGCGKTKISFRSNFIANITNLLFNYLLIGGHYGFPKLGVRGAAIATMIGMIVGCTVSVVTLLDKKGYLNFFVLSSYKITKETMGPIIRVSKGSLAEQIFMRAGFFVTNAIVARLGTVPYSTHLIASNILTMSFCMGDGLSVAVSSLVGQNLGARNIDGAKRSVKTGETIAMICATGMMLFFLLSRNWLIGLFSDKQEIISMGANIMIIMAFTTHMQISQVIFSGCLRGAGDSNYVAMVSLISLVVIRPALTYLMCYPVGLGILGAWVALVTDQSFRFFGNFLRYRGGKWSRIRL